MCIYIISELITDASGFLSTKILGCFSRENDAIKYKNEKGTDFTKIHKSYVIFESSFKEEHIPQSVKDGLDFV